MVDKFLNTKRDSISINFIRFYKVFMKDYLIWGFLVRFDGTLKIWPAKLLFDERQFTYFWREIQIIPNYWFCYDPLTKTFQWKNNLKNFMQNVSNYWMESPGTCYKSSTFSTKPQFILTIFQENQKPNKSSSDSQIRHQSMSFILIRVTRPIYHLNNLHKQIV